MAKTVVGNYSNAIDARNKVNNLIEEGYPLNSISVIANRSMASELDDTGVTIERDFDYVDGVTDETLWERIKSFFGRNNDRLHDANLVEYRDSILNGDVLVLVDDYLLPTDVETVDNTYVDTNYQAAHAAIDDDETLRLRQERLQVDKEKVQSGEVVLHKRVVEETKTVDVPVYHEELVIERRAINDESTDDDRFDEETITVPLMEEQVEVTKRPVITEEVKVHKRGVEDTQKVSATTRREELEVERDGKVTVVDDSRIK